MGWGYGTLASEVYDLDKPIGSSFGDVEYYRDALDGIEGCVLEPAVGTGRILIPLLTAGVDMQGYDSSPQMLAICRAYCAERDLDPVLRDGDMTSFVEEQRYAAVIVPTGSITLLTGRQALVDALGCFRACSAPGGRLIVDVPAPQLLAEPKAMRSWSSGDCVWTLQTMHVDYDAAANQTQIGGYAVRRKSVADGLAISRRSRNPRIGEGFCPVWTVGWRVHETA
jgi:hypothetical protein